ncbi:O-antigen ligase family protein [Pseudobutyrivibrio sp. UC1225]|uniref:O-antigen ligase family protein n=1 Tax=Pseudobutyrivibrio sp. UC1225 TaxID=1798185 RepID=UPI0015A5F2EF|nr:O-antigen ligase family protein [Pseudobutyrivibrio sp. UC1225]
MNLKEFSFKKLSLEYKLLIGYFVFRLVSNIYYLPKYTQPAKAIMEIIFEQLLLVIAFYLLAPTKEEINTTMKILVYTATIFFILGILESLSGVRLFNALYTVSRGMVNEYYYRLGLLRATTSLLMPGTYGNMCILMLPLILYMYQQTSFKRYLVSVGLCSLAIVHSGSRAVMMYLAVLLFIYFIYVIRTKEARIRFSKNCITIVACIFVFVAVASLQNPLYKYYYVTSGKSVLNEVGFDFDLSEGAPANTSFGTNSHGSRSRIRQLSGILYTSRINPILGLGAGAQQRADVHYYWDNHWHPVGSYDLGIVEIFCNEGLVGTIGMLFCILALLLLCKHNRIYILMFIAYILSTLNTANMYPFLMLYVVLLLEYRQE